MLYSHTAYTHNLFKELTKTYLRLRLLGLGFGNHKNPKCITSELICAVYKSER